ncbi:MAG: proline dehydrogenase family protein, partial [Ferruginibacter sp.]
MAKSCFHLPYIILTLITIFAKNFSSYIAIMLSFDNTELAYAYKTNAELKKAKFLFWAMNSPLLLKIGLAITPPAIKWNCPFVKPLLRKTIFSQFVGGENLQQTASVAKKLGNYNVKVILDYGVEGGINGEEGFDHATEVFIDVINYAATQINVPFMSIKVTGIARGALLEKLDTSMKGSEGTLMNRYSKAVDALSQNEKEEWQKVVNRLAKICEVAVHKKIGVLVDAEETWIQDPVDAITLMMMDKFNKIAPLIYNTVQLYRHDRLAFLKECHKAALEREFILAIKIVRGAYMEKERERAAEKD